MTRRNRNAYAELPVQQNNHTNQRLENYQDTLIDLVIGLKDVMKEDTKSLERAQIIDAED